MAKRVVQGLDLGIIAEGPVELDPMTGRFGVRSVEADGSSILIDVGVELEQYKGMDVRLIITPLATVAQIAKMVDPEDTKS
jgi:hypothetical protein